MTSNRETLNKELDYYLDSRRKSKKSPLFNIKKLISGFGFNSISKNDSPSISMGKLNDSSDFISYNADDKEAGKSNFNLFLHEEAPKLADKTKLLEAPILSKTNESNQHFKENILEIWESVQELINLINERERIKILSSRRYMEFKKKLI